MGSVPVPFVRTLCACSLGAHGRVVPTPHTGSPGCLIAQQPSLTVTKNGDLTSKGSLDPVFFLTLLQPLCAYVRLPWSFCLFLKFLSLFSLPGKILFILQVPVQMLLLPRSHF